MYWNFTAANLPLMQKLSNELATWTSLGWAKNLENRRISIVVPFFQHDPRGLLEDLLCKLENQKQSVELVFFDDGSPSAAFTDMLVTRIHQEESVAVLVARSERNLGRSGARNTLASLARGEFLIFLDCDMLPDFADYINKYIIEIDAGETFVYGGRSVTRCIDVSPAHRLHWYFTRQCEQISAAERETRPELYFLSSNFLVRKTIVSEIPLDQNFVGWGWEDCEWAFRVTRKYKLKHIDNPATHLGLITLDQIRQKYAESVKNFIHILKICPSLVEKYPLYRVARLFSVLHLSSTVKVLSLALLKFYWLPLSVKIRFLQIYKAALYSREI